MAYTLKELATAVDADLKGDPDCLIQAAATLINAGPGDISFLANNRYRKYLKDTKASAVILSSEELSACPTHALVMQNPYLGYAKVAQLLYPGEKPATGVAEGAHVHKTAKIDPAATVADGVHIAANVRVGPGTIIESGTVIGEDAVIGADCHLYPNITVREEVMIGDRVIVQPGAVLGSDGFGIANDAGVWIKIPQVGSLEIGNDVEIGSNTTIDRGALEHTIIENGVKIDNQVQIGHNCLIGENTAIAGCVGISGSTRIGKRCMIGGATGIAGHVEICDDVVLTAMSAITKSIYKPGVYSSGIPFTENLKWRKNIARFRNLDELAKRVNNLEKKLENK